MLNNRKAVISTISLITSFLMIFLSVMCSASFISYASEKSQKTVITPHLLMVDDSKENKRVVKYFKRVGVKVTTVYDLDKVDPLLYDGLIIPGGHNIDPRIYNAKRHKKTYGTDIKKDRLQIEAVKRFAEAGKPVLGLCRGCQVINVAFGGTIKQHITWHKGFRKVKNVKGYWMYQMFGKTRKAYHYHHQCVAKLGSGLIATSYDKRSKHIESIQHATLPVYGIQWHPDLAIKKQGLKVFREFKKICIKNMKENEKKNTNDLISEGA